MDSKNELNENEKDFLFNSSLKCIDREDNSIHYRITWGMQWSATLAVALGVLYNTQISRAFDYGILNIKVVGFTICLFGALCGLLSFLGVRAAHLQIKYIIEQLELKIGKWDASLNDEKTKTANEKYIRPFGAFNKVHRIARYVSFLFPLILMFIWISLGLGIMLGSISIKLSVGIH